jgi:CRISPR-associated protein Csy2
MKRRQILLLPHIKVQNANALSSPYTIGFPAMTAWLGAVHALERQLKASDYKQLRFKSMAVVCHHIDLQTHKGQNDFVHSIIATGNPLDKNGKRPSFIEEARCHLEVSLVIECEELGLIDHGVFKTDVKHQLQAKMKLAGGDIIDLSPPELLTVKDEASLRQLTRKLMPSYCLIERRDLMKQAMQEGQDAIDALLDYLKVFNQCEQDSEGKVTWSSHRKEAGWIVPIATGFQGITALGHAKNQRDTNTPHRFAESIITLGQFIMPYRITDLDHMLWHYQTDLENDLYCCQQNTPFMDS